MNTRNYIVRLSDCVYPKFLNDVYIRFMLEFLNNLENYNADNIDVSVLEN